MVRGLVVAVAFIVVTFDLFHTGSLQAQPASLPASAAAPAPHKVELLFVQNALSGSFDGKTLTLKGVGPALFFSDRIDIFGRWRMAAMGMALGEERGMQMGEARANPYPYPYPPPQAPRSPETVAAPPPAAPAGASAPALTSTQASAVAKLKELKSLLNQGLITQSQYQADSQKLLNQIVD